MTRPGTVRFDQGEPVCMIFPVQQGVPQTIDPEIVNLDNEPALKAQTIAWKERRDEFMAKIRARNPATLKEAWQRLHFVGKLPDGTPPSADHLHKLRLAAPVDRRVPKSPARPPET